MATIRESPAHSVNRLFSLLCLFVALVVSHFGFEGRTLGLSVLVHGHCLPFTFLTLHRIKNKTIYCIDIRIWKLSFEVYDNEISV